MPTPRLAPNATDDGAVLLTAAQVSQKVGVSPSHLYSLARKGELPHHRFGTLVRFVLDEVKEATRREPAVATSDMTFDELAAHFGLD